MVTIQDRLDKLGRGEVVTIPRTDVKLQLGGSWKRVSLPESVRVYEAKLSGHFVVLRPDKRQGDRYEADPLFRQVA